jgi:hypothetical protein
MSLFEDKKTDELLRQILQELREIRQEVKSLTRRSATLHFTPLGGNTMSTTSPPLPTAVAVGSQLQSVFQEFSGPNGTGTEVPPIGPVTYSSDSPAVATVDPNTGIVTGVSNTASGTGGTAGLATITGTDQGNGITASGQVSVTPGTVTAQSATLTFEPIAASAAKKKV